MGAGLRFLSAEDGLRGAQIGGGAFSLFYECCSSATVGGGPPSDGGGHFQAEGISRLIQIYSDSM